MKLSKIIPSRLKAIEFSWCSKDWCKFDEGFRRGRARFKDKLDHCFWCNNKFNDGEQMSIAAPEKGKNKVLCGNCADELISSKSVTKE